MAGNGALNDLEMAAWSGVLRAHAHLIAELDDELSRRHNLPLSSYDVLVQLDGAAGGQLRMSELADAVILSRSGLTRLVARLAKQGLVERRECENDARGAYAVITEEGRRRLAEARQTHRTGIRERFLDRLSETEQRQLARIWESVGV